MPIYEYKCVNCSLKFDYLVRNNHEVVLCPGCQSARLRKLISSFAFNSKDSNGNITSHSSNCGSCASRNCATCSG